MRNYGTLFFILILLPPFLHGERAIAADATLALTGSVEGNEVILTLTAASDQEFNALQGTIQYPENLLELKKIENGNSIIPLWLRRPMKDTTSPLIQFSGVIPGGFHGRGEIVSLVFEVTTSGKAEVNLEGIKMLRNDGRGEELAVALHNFSMPLRRNEKISLRQSSLRTDTLPPEPFTPEIVKSVLLFNNAYTLIFAAIDRQSGIDHYEVLEVPHGFTGEAGGAWHAEESPYLLKDQALTSDIYVRAVDRENNFIMVKIDGRTRYQNGTTVIVLILVLLGIGAACIPLWKYYLRRL